MKVFIEKDTTPLTGLPIGAIVRKTGTIGEVGIEIECEGNKFPLPRANVKGTHTPVPFDKSAWSYVHDGSLRGDDNAEYVLSKPILFSEVPAAVDELWSKLDKFGTVLDDSNRTSVHVHLNVQTFHLNRLAALMAIYFTFEELLTEFCGSHRVGNLFCLRAKDAPAIVSQMKKFIIADGKYPLKDGMHYAGFNAGALFKFGSVEIRTLRGATSPGIVTDWVAILERIYRASADYTDPRDFCGLLSSEGPTQFFDSILGDKAVLVREVVGWDEERVRESLYEGIRMAQDICYCRPWEDVANFDLKPDPFGRDPQKIVNKLQAFVTSAAPPIAYQHFEDDDDEIQPDWDDDDEDFE